MLHPKERFLRICNDNNILYLTFTDRVRKRQSTDAFIRKMIPRKWSIESLFAEAKQFHGFRRARYRRLHNVSIQALMTAQAQNIKRITK